MKVLAQLPSLYLLAKQAMGQEDGSAQNDNNSPSGNSNSPTGGTVGTSPDDQTSPIIITSLSDLEVLMKSKDPQYVAAQAAASAAAADGTLTQDGRSFVPGVDLLLNNLQEYGCWCFFNDRHGQGRGQPVDAFDNHCMKYHHAVSCAKLEIDSCDPYSTTYGITAKQSGMNGDITYDCETGNTACQEATCYAQSHFISLLLTEQLENLQVPNYPAWSAWKDGGNFDSETCKVSGPGSLRQEMCCGSWKYNTKKLLKFGRHLSRSCCDQPDGGFKTYDDNLASCCSDGSVRVHGTC